MSTVTNNEGKLIEVADLTLPADYIYNFVVMYTSKYFEADWSLDRCFRAIVDRGMAEIKRQVKTAVKLAEAKAAGSMLKEFNLTPEQAKKLLAQLQATKPNGSAKSEAKA